MDKVTLCVESYKRLKNLKLVGREVGIPWQSVYVYLRQAGIPVTGDKARYGSDTDRLASKAETMFAELVPDAEDQNNLRFQAKVDFVVYGHNVDVKAARLIRNSWAFSLKKQEEFADFFVGFGFDAEGSTLLRTYIFPADCMKNYQTVRVSLGNKWDNYFVDPAGISAFMKQIKSLPPIERRAA